jgi:hypothetical protein
LRFEDGDWVTITPDRYFDHSENGRQYLVVITSPVLVNVIDDATYNHYYRPSEFVVGDRLQTN